VYLPDITAVVHAQLCCIDNSIIAKHNNRFLMCFLLDLEPQERILLGIKQRILSA